MSYFLRTSLASKNNDLSARVSVIETKARELLEYSQGGAHLTFTPHGASHISAVEKNLDWLLSQKDIEDMKEIEQFCLLCSIFFHDALMIPAKIGDEVSARLKHAEAAVGYLTTHTQELALNIHEARIIGMIIQGHAVFDLKSLPDAEALGDSLVEIRKLAAILSMADICHADSSRAPEIVFKHLELSDESASHWRKHLQISGITRKDDEIIMSAIYFSDKGLKAIEDYKKQIEKQLEIVKPYFHSKLSPIVRVNLQTQQLKSPFDVPSRFQTNTEAIVDILIKSIYRREDVFIRETIQNSLDACNLRYAKAFQRKEQYTPEIVITCFNSNEKMYGIRFDDNGIGMDIIDLQDTVLWIGNSISSNDEVQKLLKSTTGKNLIATFGVGLLSCFKVAKKITIRSKKENKEPVEFSTMSVKDEIHFLESQDNTTGTTIFIELKDEFTTSIKINQALQDYFKRIQFLPKVMNLEWDETAVDKNRDEILRLALTNATLFEPKNITPSNCVVQSEIKGDDYTAWLWMEKDSIDGTEGKITILNEGIFVSIDDAHEWIPRHIQFLNGAIDFFSRSIDLPVSRDKVIQNEKMNEKKKDIALRSITILENLVALTKGSSSKTGDSLALVVCYAYTFAENNVWKEKILGILDDYYVKVYQKYRDFRLKDICDTNRQKVYLEYQQGGFVSYYANFDGEQLYHSFDNDVQLYATQLRQAREYVISASRLDIHDHNILESDILKKYFASKNIQIVDLTSRNDDVNDKIEHLSMPLQMKSKLSSNIAFAEFNEFPNRRGVKIGSEIILNTSHPKVKKIYRLIKSRNLSPVKVNLINALTLMLAGQFEDAINVLMDLIVDEVK